MKRELKDNKATTVFTAKELAALHKALHVATDMTLLGDPRGKAVVDSLTPLLQTGKPEEQQSDTDGDDDDEESV